MDWKRKKKLMIRWSLLTAGLIALFWTIWYLIAGSVPEVSSVKITPGWTVALPFAISRWWDILLGPIYPIIIILLLTSEKIYKDEKLFSRLFFGLVIVLVAGAVVGPADGLFFGLVIGLVFVLVAGAVAVLVVGLKYLFSRNFWSAVGKWLAAK